MAIRDKGVAALDQAKLKQRGSLLLGAEHQLRQPLNAVSLLIGELSQGVSGRDRDAVIDDLRYALTLSNHWLDSLVELEKVDQGLVTPKLSDLSLDEVFDRIKEEFAESFSGLGLDFRIVRCSQVVRADPALLRRILTVLLDNAAKFTREGKVLLGCRRMGAMIRIEVWDSGLGVASDEWLRVFDPYFRLENEVRPRERGLGLGLTLARKLAALSGDQLEVSSRLGEGSCFSLTLRAVDSKRPQVPRARDRSGIPPNPLDNARILLLERDEADLLANHFGLWGAKVQQTAATAAALAQELETRPALLVADQATFQACGGWDLLAAAGQGKAAMPAVILLGNDTAGSPRQAAVPVHFLSRPVRPARLRALCLFALAPP